MKSIAVDNPNSGISITIDEGLNLPGNLAIPADSCGMDFWLSEAVSPWMSQTFGAVPVTVRLSDSQGRHAWLVLWLRRLLPGLTLASGQPYSTVLGDRDLFLAHSTSVARALAKMGVSRIEMGLSGEHLPHYTSLIKPPLEQLRQVIQLDIFQNTSELEKSYPSGLRWSIKKSLKEGASVKTASPEEAVIAQQLYARTMKEQGAPVYYDHHRFRLIAETFAHKGQGKLLLAHIDGVPVGMAAAIDASSTRHLIQVAIPKQFHASRVGDLLVATLMADALQSGKQYFDFMASPAEDTGLLQYKSKWGGKTEEVRYIVIHANPLRSKLIAGLRYSSRALPRIPALLGSIRPGPT